MIRIFSDGGADNRESGGAACIVLVNDKPYCIGCYLGSSTNNEGEIFAALIGFSFVRYLARTTKLPNKIEWISDSEYALKSATQYIFNWEKNGWKTSSKEPVKNQGLWRTFLSLTQGLKFNVQHVKGHSGHTENEACDSAVTWTRKNFDKFDSDWLAEKVDISDATYPFWFMKDARELISEIRLNEESGISKDDFIEEFSFESLSNIPEPDSSKRSEVKTEDPNKKILKLSKDYLKKIKQISNNDPELDQILLDLRKWIEKSE